MSECLRVRRMIREDFSAENGSEDCCKSNEAFKLMLTMISGKQIPFYLFKVLVSSLS